MVLGSETGDIQPHGEGLPAAPQNQGQWGALHYLHELPTPSHPTETAPQCFNIVLLTLCSVLRLISAFTEIHSFKSNLKLLISR